MGIKRTKQPMPGFIKDALDRHGVMNDYLGRPAYQRNDYLGWIISAKQQQTREKRLLQMIEELERGGIYMKMEHPASRKKGKGGGRSMKNAPKSPDRDGADEVDSYLSGFSGDVGISLEAHRQMIKKAAPGCSERISYGMPVFRQGTDLCGIQAYKNFCSFYTMDKKLAEELSRRYEKIEVVSTAIRFYPDKPIPYEVIEEVIKTKLDRRS